MDAKWNKRLQTCDPFTSAGTSTSPTPTYFFHDPSTGEECVTACDRYLFWHLTLAKRMTGDRILDTNPGFKRLYAALESDPMVLKHWPENWKGKDYGQSNPNTAVVPHGQRYKDEDKLVESGAHGSSMQGKAKEKPSQ